MLGFPLTSSRLASSQVGVTVELEIWYMRLRFLSASVVRVSLASFLLDSLQTRRQFSEFLLRHLVLLLNTSASHLSVHGENRSRLQLLPNLSLLLLANHSVRALTDNGLLLLPLASSSAP